MSDFEYSLGGIGNLQEEFADEIEDWSGGKTMFVGTAVEYSVYVEFGTSKMDPRPYFRPALTEAQANLTGFINDHTNTTADAIESADQLVETIGLAMERRVKEIITEKGLIDTGTLRASIRAVDSESELVAADEVDI